MSIPSTQDHFDAIKMKIKPSRILAAMALIWSGAACFAQSVNPEGLWKNIDDKTGTPRSEIRIEIKSGVMSGTVVRSLRPDEDPAAKCVKCSGELKDRAIVGMAILTGLKVSTDDPLTWEGGNILDPDSGSQYRAKIYLMPGGKSLEMRGYLGAPLFGRTQTWYRVE
jgi:uncharacterized protein (DUF2147 family)